MKVTCCAVNKEFREILILNLLKKTQQLILQHEMEDLKKFIT